MNDFNVDDGKFLHSDGPMHKAVIAGHVDLIFSLAASQPQLIDFVDLNLLDRTPIFVAAMNGRNESVEALCQAGSKALDRPDSCGMTPMSMAAHQGHASIVETLIRHGATAHTNGVEVLKTAFRLRRPEVAQVLLAAGVDPAPLADEYPDLVRDLLSTPEDRLAELRQRIAGKK